MPIQQVPNNQIRPNPTDQIGGVLNQGIQYFQKPQFYGKFRAYCFINFGCIALLLVLITFMFFKQGESAAAMGCLIMSVLAIALCYLIWLPVKRKVQPQDRRLVFWGFFASGVLIFGKILLIVLIITIPLALRIGGDNPYSYRMVQNGVHAGEYVLCRQKLNGQIEDIYGNIYEEA